MAATENANVSWRNKTDRVDSKTRLFKEDVTMRRRKYPDPKGPILKALMGKSGLSMAEICRTINEQTNILYCGRRRCGFPNPRKRKHFTLYPYSCKYPYSSVTAKIRKMKRKGTVTITREKRFDKFVGKHGAFDTRQIVRLQKSQWKW